MGVRCGVATLAVAAIAGCTGGAGDDTTASAGSLDGSMSDAVIASGDASHLDAGADGAADAADGAAIDASGCEIGEAGEPTALRCTGLYSDWPSKTVSADAREYDPGLSQWNDGATKRRWIYLPPGTAIDSSNMDEWVFPAGTKVWQEISIGGRRIETRHAWKMGGAFSWYATTYRWSADESTADELVDGATNADGNGYEIQPQQVCADCHLGRMDYLLGFEAVSLSSAGATGATIGVLAAQGLLNAPPASPITIPGTTTDVAALGYLHTNCGTSCHNAGSGAASTTELHLRLDVATLRSVQATDAWTTGWNVRTNFTGLSGDAGLRIAPCNPGGSGVSYRMSQRDGLNGALPGRQMPPVDTHKVDTAGVAAVAGWIDEGCADAGAVAPSDAGPDR
jgi:hypothetical protein